MIGMFFMRIFLLIQMFHGENVNGLRNGGSTEHVYHSLGIKYFNLVDVQKALEYHQLDLKVAEDAGNKVRQGSACAHLGRAFFHLGNIKMAIKYHQERLSIAKDLGDNIGQGRAYASLGNAYHSLGNFKKALEYYEKRLCIAKDLETRTVQGDAYASVGIAHYSLGEFDKAIEYHQLDLSIAEDLEDKAGQRRAYANLGVAYQSICNLGKALEYHHLDYCISKEFGDKDGQERAYGNLGNTYGSLGDTKKAFEYHKKAFDIAEVLGNDVVLGGANANLGNAYHSLGDFGEAEACHFEHLRIAEKIGDKAGQAGAYANLGRVHRDLGKFREAFGDHQLELRICQEAGDKVGEGRAYANLGRVCHYLRDFNEALEYHKQDLKIAKDCKTISGQARAHGNLGRVYHSLGDLTNAEDCFKSSVSFCEKMRDFDMNDDCKISLRNHYKDAYTALCTVQLEQNKIVEALFTAERGRGQALNDLMTSQYDLTPAKESQETEEISNVTNSISSQTVFLAGGRQAINIWVLEKGREFHFVRKEITDDSLQPLIDKAYQQIGVLQTNNMSPVQRADGKGTTSNDYIEDALKLLHDMVISPVTDVMRSSEINIVPDGLLFLVPFAALKDRNCNYLSESFSIRLIPSLTTLKLMAECPEGYHCTTGALLVGDPWVENVRIRGERVKQLPSAKEEVEMISKILKTENLTGKMATKAEVLSRLNSVALVHIAAHGRAETGEIVLSPNPTSYKRPKEADFLLNMKDVLDVKLRAKLVVLRCCYSGRGDINAEGVVGIARAFLGAGARSVVASLWKIDDSATLEFMRHFYQHLLEGNSTSKSMKQAMRCMRESDDFSDVRYWAPFVLIGDDVTMNFAKTRWGFK